MTIESEDTTGIGTRPWRDFLAKASLADQCPPHFPAIVGASKAMTEALSRVGKVAESESNVCIYGESGTGKELVARAIHYSGHRANGPMVVFDCAAVPAGLMESEIFGHDRGAYTSAVSAREGVFELANGGTLFLDEVGELPLPLQARLLRIIESRELRRVGGKHSIKVDVRIIAATNRDLRAMVAMGTFREDLLYRLQILTLTLPPLRERKEDIPLVVDHFIQQFNRRNKKQIRGVSPPALDLLLRYSWPGNVRELENCILRVGVLGDDHILDIQDLPEVFRSLPSRPLGRWNRSGVCCDEGEPGRASVRTSAAGKWGTV